MRHRPIYHWLQDGTFFTFCLFNMFFSDHNYLLILEKAQRIYCRSLFCLVSEFVSHYYTDHSKHESNCQVTKDGLKRVTFTTREKTASFQTHKSFSPSRECMIFCVSCRKSRCVQHLLFCKFQLTIFKYSLSYKGRIKQSHLKTPVARQCHSPNAVSKSQLIHLTYH